MRVCLRRGVGMIYFWHFFKLPLVLLPGRFSLCIWFQGPTLMRYPELF